MSEMFWTKQLRNCGNQHTNINVGRADREPYTITAEQKAASAKRRAEQRRNRDKR